jgi:hypothetical protein
VRRRGDGVVPLKECLEVGHLGDGRGVGVADPERDDLRRVAEPVQVGERGAPALVRGDAVGEEEHHGPVHVVAFRLQRGDVLLDGVLQQPEDRSEGGHTARRQGRQMRQLAQVGERLQHGGLRGEADQREASLVRDTRVGADLVMQVGQRRVDGVHAVTGHGAGFVAHHVKGENLHRWLS